MERSDARGRLWPDPGGRARSEGAGERRAPGGPDRGRLGSRGRLYSGALQGPVSAGGRIEPLEHGAICRVGPSARENLRLRLRFVFHVSIIMRLRPDVKRKTDILRKKIIGEETVKIDYRSAASS